jgi:hypothetical protein
VAQLTHKVSKAYNEQQRSHEDFYSIPLQPAARVVCCPERAEAIDQAQSALAADMSTSSNQPNSIYMISLLEGEFLL